MEFNQHSELQGKHAFLSGSTYYWTNYTPEKLRRVYLNTQSKERGIELHDLAEKAIRHRVKMSTAKQALQMFVNDAIGFRMEPEVVLYYSHNSFGTADAISFNNNLLRIHDLKTGFTKVSFRQLYIYTALFCLEYSIDPYEIDIKLRIYQGNGYEVDQPDPNEIKEIMDKIVEFDMLIEQIDMENPY